MNENTTKIIEQLAQKLGTTSEYLWGVLIKQAPIDAILSLFYLFVIIACMFVMWKIHKFMMKENKYSEHEDTVFIPISVSLVMLLILFILAFECIKTIIIGFLNPEYFALQQILETLN